MHDGNRSVSNDNWVSWHYYQPKGITGAHLAAMFYVLALARSGRNFPEVAFSAAQKVRWGSDSTVVGLQGGAGNLNFSLLSTSLPTWNRMSFHQKYAGFPLTQYGQEFESSGCHCQSCIKCGSLGKWNTDYLCARMAEKLLEENGQRTRKRAGHAFLHILN